MSSGVSLQNPMSFAGGNNKMTRGWLFRMRCPRSSCLAFVAALALSGCSYGDNLLDWATGTTATDQRGRAEYCHPDHALDRRSPIRSQA